MQGRFSHRYRGIGYRAAGDQRLTIGPIAGCPGALSADAAPRDRVCR
jgi:hypothetical protein